MEDFFRRNALAWSLETRQGPRFFYVLVEDLGIDVADGEPLEQLIGCIAVEQGELEDEWFIMALAIEERFQGRKHGGDLLTTILSHLRTVSPGGGAYWHVEVGNTPSERMSERVGAEGTCPPGYDGLTLYTVPLTPDT